MFVSDPENAIDWATVRDYYAGGASPRDCRVRFGIPMSDWRAATRHGLVVLRSRAARPAGETRGEVARLLAAGLTQSQIASTLRVSKPTVSFHARQLGIPSRAECANRYDWDAVGAFYAAGHTARECQERFGFGRSAWANAIKRGVIVPRPRLEPTESLLAAGRRRCRHHIKGRLLVEGIKQPRCEECGIDDWMGRPIALELHHANGDGLDNRVENLRLLCPNCHSQTDTWGGRNKGRRKAA